MMAFIWHFLLVVQVPTFRSCPVFLKFYLPLKAGALPAQLFIPWFINQCIENEELKIACMMMSHIK